MSAAFNLSFLFKEEQNIVGRQAQVQDQVVSLKPS